MRSPSNVDPSESATMEDPTAMTIEFLRARLLSERSISRTSRQRADELARRVMELEEELKIVSLQKKKAEKATADVLAILESHGVSDLSETLDSISDQEEVPCESKVSNSCVKEEEVFVSSRLRENGAEEFSGSELESSPVTGRNLSWNSSKDSQHSRDRKYMDTSMRRRSDYVSPSYSSPKHRPGRSCRRIKRKEKRSVVEDLKDEEAEPANRSGDFVRNYPVTLEEDFQNQEEKASQECRDSDCLVKERKETSAAIERDGRGGEKSMQRALENQPVLFGRYEVEEKAQREWEEKFRENNSSNPDSCEPGNHSDVTEERDEYKLTPYLGQKTAPLDQKSKSKVHSFQNGSGSQTNNCDSSASKFAFPTAKENLSKEHDKNQSSSPSNSLPRHTSPADFHRNQSESIASPSHSRGTIFKPEASESQKEIVPVTNEMPGGIGGVLEALQQAKLSLKQKMNSLSLKEAGLYGKARGPPFLAPDRIEIPIGCAPLFRVPTDLQCEASSTRPNSSSGLALTNYPYTGNALAATSTQFPSSPTCLSASTSAGDVIFRAQTDGWSRQSNQRLSSDYPFVDNGGLLRRANLEPQFDVSGRNQLLARPSGSRPSVRIGFADPGLSLSRSYNTPYPVYPDPIRSNEGGFSRGRSVSSREPEPPVFYDDNVRPDMYRYS